MNHYIHCKEIFQHSKSFYMISTDVNGCYQYVNPAYQTRFYHVAKDIVGQPFHITMHPEDIAVVEAAAAKCFAEPEKTFPASLRKHNGNGGYVITQWDFKLIRNEAGEFNGFFCIGYDLTEFENEKLKNNKLKYQLSETTNDLEYKSDLLKEVVFDQSHLIRSPLSNILGLVNILQKLQHDENTTHLIEMLKTSGESLDKVVKTIVKKVYDKQLV